MQSQLNQRGYTRWQSALVAEARRQGWAVFYPSYPDEATQIRKTVEGAEKYLGRDQVDSLYQQMAAESGAAACGPGCPASINAPAPCAGCVVAKGDAPR